MYMILLFIILVNDLFLQLSEKVDRHENQIQEINIKLVDLNLIDLVKDRLAVDGKQDESILINLISNLQKKFDQKSEIDSRRFKTLEDEIMKLKNDIVNIKNTNENFNKSLIALQEDIQMIYSKLQDLRDYIHTSTDENKTYFNAGIRTLDENIDNKIKEYVYV